MENEFLPYELAVKLKELGFDEPCLGFYNHQGQLILMAQEDESSIEMYKNSYVEMGMQYAAPLFQQAFRWFREKHNFVGTILGDGFNGELKGYYYSITEQGWINYYESIDDGKWYESYEEAELACLNKLIEIVKEK